ncbi:ferric reductase-like transmembrane domain-containing protein [Roseibium porphyridii]|uniref:Ferric reductase-like transmembrane domain-containing protein n=1 Tax=Roseibium porphyridii TaxID=2866279 RepID=A0ABY8F6V0_9HYPH|nr:ferric reductase-like transmembrane domain-containing protein [Roseibium sp. KMA01]WFE89595.1 ferric reductase-like transmembrane domain-containing protein [Roseibium sp. KMA01]
MSRTRGYLVWSVLAIVIALPILAAATSPLLAWRQPVYILAGFAGVAGMALLLVQPLLAGGYLPGLTGARGRRIHRITGALLVAAVLLHVGGLWITSPPDVVDALLFRSPTPFSVWGVLAMWAVLAAAFLAAFRRRLRLKVRIWRRTHTALAMVIVTGSAIHALLIEGTMETMTKFALCALVIIATVKVMVDLNIWTKRSRREV